MATHNDRECLYGIQITPLGQQWSRDILAFMRVHCDNANSFADLDPRNNTAI